MDYPFVLFISLLVAVSKLQNGSPYEKCDFSSSFEQWPLLWYHSMTSRLRFIPESSAAVPIDWSKIPKKSKKFFVDVCVSSRITNEDTIERSLPQTIGGLAESFHEKKFFGYMQPELCQLLLDINEFGLQVWTTKRDWSFSWPTILYEVWVRSVVPAIWTGMQSRRPRDTWV